MHCGVDHFDIAGRRWRDQPRGAGDVGVQYVVTESYPVIALRKLCDLTTCRDSSDALADISVCGWHDLATGAEIHLVAVIARWVVTCSNHHAGGATQISNSKCQNRGG